LRLAAFAFAITIGADAAAEAWFDPGDVRLRHDLQLLADADLLNIPLTTWPVSVDDVARALSVTDATHTGPAIQTAHAHVTQRLNSMRAPGFSAHTRVAYASDPQRLRTFTAAPREEGEAEVGLSWQGETMAVRLQVTAAEDPQDDKTPRLDGSHASTRLGNWWLGVGALDRWWGPGWDGSLILSTNARPVPALMLARNQSHAFASPWLAWLGPWQLHAFIGQLEGDRDIPRAKLLGARFTFKPARSLEIGLSRTAQWGGEGRPEDLDTFVDLLTGNDNRGDDGINAENEPGNQLAGYDLRWAIGPSFAFYGQSIGEDSAGSAPSRFMNLGGVETWAGRPGGGSYRLRLEYADTKAKLLNYAYNHGIYTDGYRYRGRTLGHAMDNDGRMVSLGALLARASGTTWELLARETQINRDNAGQNAVSAAAQTMTSLELVMSSSVGQNTFLWGISVVRGQIETTGDTHTDFPVFVQWRRR
jgi:hypothetical protein